MENKGIWIPAEIIDTTLSWSEKALLALIQSLSNGRPCTATTNYLAEYLQITPLTIKNCLKSLKDKGFIDVKIYQDRENTKKREVYFLSLPKNYTHHKNYVGGGYKNYTGGGDKNYVGGGYKNYPIEYIDKNNNKKVEEKAPTSIFDVDQDVLHCYQDNIQMITKPIELEKLADDIERYGADKCIEAIKRAVIRNKRSLGYVESILHNWEVNGYDTGEGKKEIRRSQPRYASDIMAEEIAELEAYARGEM